MLKCPCMLQYVGRTSRPLMVRVQEHINNIKNGKKDHSVPKHFREVHGRNSKCLNFWGVEKVKPH